MKKQDIFILTAAEIEAHEHFSGKLLLPDGYTYYTLFPGGDKLWYSLKNTEGVTLFAGVDYRPSPHYRAIDCIESVVGGLSFLTIQEGAVDSSYFAQYTEEQIGFRDSPLAEKINLLIFDFENDCTSDEDDKESHLKAKKYFEDNYKN